ncbi:hypothetical protein BD413DRAFT_679467 [Trametes elegans]|nr:hypothetical protein BD413DRAFT_679467 [Trametes elegans]
MSFVVIQQVVEMPQSAPMHANYAFHFTLPDKFLAALVVVSFSAILVASYFKGKQLHTQSATSSSYALGRNVAEQPADRQQPAPVFNEPFQEPGTKNTSPIGDGAPARTIASRFQPAKASEQFDRVLRRTRSFSAHILSNSTKPIMRAPTMFMNHTNLLLTKGNRALNPTRTFIGLPVVEDQALNSDDPAHSSASEDDSEMTSSSSDQSITEEEETLPLATTSAPVDPLELAAGVSRAASEPASVAQFPPQSPHSSRAPSIAERSMTNTTPSLSSKSISQQSSRASLVRTPVAKDPRRRSKHVSEPVRYARPACPENSIPAEKLETRYENPLKFIFRGKGKGKGAAGETPSSPRKKRNSLMKSSASVRRMLSTVYMPFAAEATAKVQAAELEEESTSGRFSVTPTPTGPSEAASIRTSASKASGSSRRSVPRSDSRVQTTESEVPAEIHAKTEGVQPSVGSPAGSTA